MKNYSHHWLVDPFPDAPDNRRCPVVQSWEKSRRHGRHEKRLRTKGVMLRVVSVFGAGFFFRSLPGISREVVTTSSRQGQGQPLGPGALPTGVATCGNVTCNAGLNSRSTVVCSIQVSKAYAALTDESARKNYEKCRAKQSIWRSRKKEVIR